jgi:elongation factor 3
VWRHHALRVAYIAQHSRHHLETCVHQTPVEYIQARYFLGEDKEVAMSHGLMLTDDEHTMRKERGQVKDALPTTRTDAADSSQSHLENNPKAAARVGR